MGPNRRPSCARARAGPARPARQAPLRRRLRAGLWRLPRRGRAPVRGVRPLLELRAWQGPRPALLGGRGWQSRLAPVLGARGLPVLCQPRFAGVWEGRTRLCLRVPFFPFPSSPWEGCGAGQAFAVLEKSRPPLALVANGCRGFLLQRKEALPGAVTMQHRNLSTFDGQMQPCDSSGDLFTLKLSGFYAGAFP